MLLDSRSVMQNTGFDIMTKSLQIKKQADMSRDVHAVWTEYRLCSTQTDLQDQSW